MIKKIVRISLCFLLLIPYFLEPFAVNASSKATTIAGLKEELENLKKQKKDAANDKKQTQSEIAEKNAQIVAAREEQDKITEDIAKAELEISESNEKIEKSKEEIDSLMKYYQLSSSENIYLEYITGASTPTEFVMRVEAVSQISDYYHRKIDELNELITKNENLKVELANKKVELEEVIEKNSKLLDSLNDQISEINEINEDIDSQIKNQEALIKYYQTVCSSDTQLLSSCVSVAASTGWLRPLVKGKITSNWGYRGVIISGTSSFHNGIDIGGNNEGTPIYATASGTVAAVTRKSSCGGNIVYIHNNVNGKAYTTQFAHLLSIKVSVGDEVDVNTVIGTVGGGPQTWSWDKCSTGKHLHYGISTGYYLGGGADGYSSWSKFIANSIKPTGFPAKGVTWYNRG